MQSTASATEIFLHIRVVMAIVLGMGITRLLTGVARFVAHPGKYRLYAVHLGWVGWMLLMLIHFWWWEFWLQIIESWTFETYLFLIVYTAIRVFFLGSPKGYGFVVQPGDWPRLILATPFKVAAEMRGLPTVA